jgi:uncharacterized protein YydD (DUF2326 family)
MVNEKVKFITKELPSIEKSLEDKNDNLRRLLVQEKEFANAVSKSDSFETLEIVIVSINENYRKKGEYETIIEQLNEVETHVKSLNKELNEIDDELFSDNFEQTVKTQLNKFNKLFAAISDELYGEQYAIKYDITTDKKNHRIYKFSPFVHSAPNIASGKKQGEISSFDIAYTLFADEENIPCLHFLLNDKKELMHDNQLVKIADFVGKQNIQFVASILRDKLPNEMNREEFFVVKLSQDDKLFRIES